MGAVLASESPHSNSASKDVHSDWKDADLIAGPDVVVSVSNAFIAAQSTGQSADAEVIVVEPRSFSSSNYRNLDAVCFMDEEDADEDTSWMDKLGPKNQALMPFDEAVTEIDVESAAHDEPDEDEDDEWDEDDDTDEVQRATTSTAGASTKDLYDESTDKPPGFEDYDYSKPTDFDESTLNLALYVDDGPAAAMTNRRGVSFGDMFKFGEQDSSETAPGFEDYLEESFYIMDEAEHSSAAEGSSFTRLLQALNRWAA